MTSSAAARTTCPACGSAELRPFFTADSVPVHCNLLYDDRSEARAAPRGDIELAFCESCGLIFNQVFDEALTAYSESYENSLYFSPAFQDYADRLTTHLVEVFDLHDKDLIEIGCGSAEFLNDLCEKGANRGHGFDPSAPPSRFPAVTIIPEFYGPDHAGYPADAVFSRHVLEHVAEPAAMLAGIRSAVDEATPFYCEVPNARFILRDLSVWDVIYEHPSYFSAETLGSVLAAAGFEVGDLYPAFGEQFLSAEAVAADTNSVFNRDLTGLSQLVDAFGSAYRDQVASWTRQVLAWKEAGHSVALWGAGSKGVTFLNAISGSEHIASIVDINPRKHGKFLPGTAHEVQGPESLVAAPPDIVLVMNPVYTDEITATLASLSLNPEVVVV